MTGLVGAELVEFLLKHPEAQWAWALVPGLVRLTPRVGEEAHRCAPR